MNVLVITSATQADAFSLIIVSNGVKVLFLIKINLKIIVYCNDPAR